MEAQNIIIAHPDNNEQIEAIKAFMKALKIKFEVAKESAYDKEFVKKIKKAIKQVENGETVAIDNIDEFLGLE